jgi:multiple sugar transport system substrate-binding protein
VPFFFKDVFLDLTSFVESDKSFDIKRFYPETLKKFESNRKLYCLPACSRSSGIIYYNKDLFKRSGAALPDDNWNTTEFLAAAKRLTADANGRHPGDKAFDPGRITTYGYAGRTWENFVYSFGGRFVDRWDDPAKCLLNENLAVAGMQFAMDLSYKQGVSPRPGVPVNGGSDRGLFVSGQLGMFQSSIGDLPDLRKEIGDRFGWDVVLFPKGPSGKRGFPTDVSGYAIYQMTGHPQEAWEVLKCLTGEAGQAMLADAGILHPSDMKIAQGEHWAANPLPPANKKALNDAVQYSEYEPFHQMWREAWDRNGAPRIELILDNKMPVKQGLDDITIDMNEFLSHR